MKKYSIFLVFVLLLAGCKYAEKAKKESLDEVPATNETIVFEQHPGKVFMEQECYICHNPKASRAEMIAPPMETIKRHYIDSSVTKAEFTEALIRWVNDPETESKMLGAHAKFGPMPYIPNPDDAIAQIADYIYDNEIERPEWFDTHFQKAHKKGAGLGECQCFAIQEPEKEYAAIGLAYAMEAKAELGRNLMQAIQNKGTVEAIQFCNTEATKLTDSVSIMKNAIIKRVSDKPRNPNNKANAEQLKHIGSFKESIASGKKIEPVVYNENSEVSFYYPITTNALCLQCHGKPDKQILPETLATLKKLYPKDKAVGYDVNEVRGIWSVTFDTDH